MTTRTLLASATLFGAVLAIALIVQVQRPAAIDAGEPVRPVTMCDEGSAPRGVGAPDAPEVMNGRLVGHGPRRTPCVLPLEPEGSPSQSG